MLPDSSTSLLEALDGPQVNCLNEDGEHTLKSILADKTMNTDPNAYLISDVDEQLILNIPFNQAVRLRWITFLSKGPPAQRPRRIKLFVNRPTLGFEDAQAAEEPEAAAIVEPGGEGVWQSVTLPLKLVRFQNVSSLHIFVETNWGDDQTRIDGIDVFGTTAGTTSDLSRLRVTEEL